MYMRAQAERLAAVLASVQPPLFAHVSRALAAVAASTRPPPATASAIELAAALAALAAAQRLSGVADAALCLGVELVTLHKGVAAVVAGGGT